MGQTRHDKSIDGMLGTQTWGGRMVGADESTELWRHPNDLYGIDVSLQKHNDIYKRKLPVP